KVQGLRDALEHRVQLIVRMAGPKLGRRQAKRVHVHHRVGSGGLFRGHLPSIETRADFALLFICKSNEDVAMLARVRLYSFVQRWQERRTAPVVNHAVALGYSVKMRSNNDQFVGTAR